MEEEEEEEGGGGQGIYAGGREGEVGRCDIIKRRIVSSICNNNNCMSSTFFIGCIRAQRRPSSSTHVFHAEGEVGHL
jgi:hypothetical protein